MDKERPVLAPFEIGMPILELASLSKPKELQQWNY